MYRVICCCCRKEESEDIPQTVEGTAPTSDNVVYRVRENSASFSREFTNPISLPAESQHAVMAVSSKSEVRQSVSFSQDSTVAEEAIGNSGYITHKELTNRTSFDEVKI